MSFFLTLESADKLLLEDGTYALLLELFGALGPNDPSVPMFLHDAGRGQ